MTHLHDDHAAGLPALIRNFRPAEVWNGLVPAEKSPLLTAVEQSAAETGSRVVHLHAGEAPESSVKVLWPAQAAVGGPKAKNDDSLVLLLSYGKHRFLLMGDAERPSEMAMQVPEEVDVLKAGHHGSRTSSNPEFLALTRPLFTLISSGEGTRTAILIGREPASGDGSRILRTDRSGAISIASDGSRITILDYRFGYGAVKAAVSNALD